MSLIVVQIITLLLAVVLLLSGAGEKAPFSRGSSFITGLALFVLLFHSIIYH